MRLDEPEEEVNGMDLCARSRVTEKIRGVDGSAVGGRDWWGVGRRKVGGGGGGELSGARAILDRFVRLPMSLFHLSSSLPSHLLLLLAPSPPRPLIPPPASPPAPPPCSRGPLVLGCRSLAFPPLHLGVALSLLPPAL